MCSQKLSFDHCAYFQTDKTTYHFYYYLPRTELNNQLFLNGNLYIVTTGHCDNGPFHFFRICSQPCLHRGIRVKIQIGFDHFLCFVRCLDCHLVAWFDQKTTLIYFMPVDLDMTM